METGENNKKQNRHWVRISAVCNNKCLFCLDSDAQNGEFIDSERVRKDIFDGYIPGEDNRLILSGGEASINPHFPEYIQYGKGLGYSRIQTVTNGNQFFDLDFCRLVFDAGLGEVTFSMHGHTEKLHDYLVGTPGAFRKSLQGIIHIRKNFPQIILNIDIVVNKINVGFLPEMIKFWMKLGIMEFDILQIIPFGRGFSEYKNELFYDPREYTSVLQKTWELSRIRGTHMWTNRFPVEVLEGYEELIQDPGKIRSETMGEGRDMFEKFIKEGKKPHCYGDRCKVCFIQQYCSNFITEKVGKLVSTRTKIVIEKDTNILEPIDNTYLILRGSEDIVQIRASFGKSAQDFIKKIRGIPVGDDSEFVNIPRCIRMDHNFGMYENHFDLGANVTLGAYTKSYIENLYRKKSLRCQKCKYNNSCEGIHINYIRTYGFAILQPLL